MDGVVNLRAMTFEHSGWAHRNFASNHSLENAVFGMVEELGELSHALLKYKQGIRAMDGEALRDKIIDAHCDLIIFSLGLPEFLDYDLAEELMKTWDSVKSRDWKANPQTGGEA